ncbi:hypothetical protein ACFSHQ_04360 [Gemmobacter lanyuensis]
MTLDPVTLAVLQAGLQQVCDEMDLTFSRAAFSPSLPRPTTGLTASMPRRTAA